MADMTGPSYDIEFDAASHILDVRMRGFWTMATFAAFSARVMVIATGARLRHGTFNVLTDMSEFPVQSQQVSSAFAAFVKTTATMKVERVALVHSSSLARMQVQRETSVEGARYFADRDEAIRWLKEGDG